MTLQSVYAFISDQLYEEMEEWGGQKVIEIAMWAKEPSLLIQWKKLASWYEKKQRLRADERFLVHEYPLDGKPPMMTHVFQTRRGKRIIAAKGAPNHHKGVPTSTPRRKPGFTKKQ
jgi:Ca2+-transporting ATPase